MNHFFRDSMKMIKSRAEGRLKNAVLRSQLTDTFTIAEVVMDEYARAMDNIRADNRLSPDGKLAERQKLTADTRARLDELQKPLERLEREVDQLQQEAAKSAKPENEVLEFLRQREIRDRLGNDPILEQRYQMAVESGQNIHIAEALESSPVPFEFVTAETRQKTLMHKLATSKPEAVERMNEISSFKTFVTAAVGSGHSAINQTANG